MTKKQIAERIGKMSDRTDNLYYASRMPLPAEAHKKILQGALQDIRDDLRKLYVEITGENPWEGGPPDAD